VRLLFINQRPYLPQQVGGVETTTFELVRQLARMGHEAAVMCSLGKHDAVWFRSRVAAHLRGRLFPSERLTCVYRGYDPLNGINEVLSDFRPSALVVTGNSPQSYELAERAATIGLPCVYYLCDIVTVRALKTPAMLDGLSLGVMSAYTARVLAELWGRQSTVIRPLIDPPAYRTVPTRRCVTMVNPRRIKGGETAYELARACPDIPFVFVEAWEGDEPFVTRLRAAARQLRNVKWLRTTMHMRRLYRMTRILLAPSEWEEAWGRVVSEAHLSGIPALASTMGGLPESVGPGGILVDAGAPLEEWIRALRSMWDDHALYEQLSARALEYSRREEVQPLYQTERLLALLAARPPQRCDARNTHTVPLSAR